MISEDQASHSESDLLTSTGGAEAAWGAGEREPQGFTVLTKHLKGRMLAWEVFKVKLPLQRQTVVHPPATRGLTRSWGCRLWS